MTRPPQTTTFSLNLAPMVDVIMCLLIFFMLAAKMVERENSPIDLPVAASALEAEKQALGNRLVVNILSSAPGDAGPVYVLGGESVPLSGLISRLEHEASVDPTVNCVIRGDRGVPYRAVEAILRGCAAAGIENITFSAVRGEGGD